MADDRGETSNSNSAAFAVESNRINTGDDRISLADASIIQVDLLDESIIVVEFSNGDTITLEAAKLKELALTNGLARVKVSQLDPD